MRKFYEMIESIGVIKIDNEDTITRRVIKIYGDLKNNKFKKVIVIEYFRNYEWVMDPIKEEYEISDNDFESIIKFIESIK